MNTPSSVPKIIDDDAGEISAVLDGKEIRAWSYRGDVVRIQKMRCAHEFAYGWIAAMKHAVDAQIAVAVQQAAE